jgi:hypothetical protein
MGIFDECGDTVSHECPHHRRSWNLLPWVPKRVRVVADTTERLAAATRLLTENVDQCDAEVATIILRQLDVIEEDIAAIRRGIKDGR